MKTSPQLNIPIFPHPVNSGTGKRAIGRRGFGKLMLGAVSPLLLTLIGWLFHDLLTQSNILLLYLLGVFFVAIHFGLWPSIIASLSGAACFAFFFAPPIFSFAIADRENLAGLAGMLVVGAVSSKLAENVRYQMRVAQENEQRMLALYQLSKELAQARMEQEIAEIGARRIRAEFGCENVILFPDKNGRLSPCRQPAPLDFSRRVDLHAAGWAFAHGQMAGPGTPNLAGEGLVYLPLAGSTGAIGVLALEPVDLPRGFPPEQRQLLDTFVNQIVQTLERASLAEQAKDATVKMQSELLRNSLLSSISHDLRAPLATIVAAASSLEADAGRLNEASRTKLAAAISEEAQRMTDLTVKILEMARLSAGEVILNRQWYEPEEIVGCALRRLDRRLRTRQVNLRMDSGLALVYVDAVLLQQVLVNLLENADKYSGPGLPIEVGVQATPEMLSIVVSDRGPGIADEFKERIFDKFFQIRAEGAQSGVGLGLSICRAIVEAHGGEIRVGGGREGTEFLVRLPIPACAPTVAPEDNPWPD